MIIAGLTGGIGHGKTTFATLLAAKARSAHHFESWELIAEVATALRSEGNPHPSSNDTAAVNEWLFSLPDIVSLHTHQAVKGIRLRITPERLAAHPEHYTKLFEYLRHMHAQPALQTIDITVDNKEQFRSLLQWLGGYLVATIGSGIWYDEIVRRIALLRASGCELVTVGGVRYPADAERLRNAGGVIIEIERPDQPHLDAQDLTERERKAIKPDSVVMNNASIALLSRTAETVYADMSRRQLQIAYTTTLQK